MSTSLFERASLSLIWGSLVLMIISDHSYQPEAFSRIARNSSLVTLPSPSLSHASMNPFTFSDLSLSPRILAISSFVSPSPFVSF